MTILRRCNRKTQPWAGADAGRTVRYEMLSFPIMVRPGRWLFIIGPILDLDCRHSDFFATACLLHFFQILCPVHALFASDYKVIVIMSRLAAVAVVGLAIGHLSQSISVQPH